ncbi:PREDICTED: eukaryotic translation initiation factor 4E type 2-like [Amphimedon queenslandica]|uniref:EIF-4F 25 kDa subunit n=1 Tax=Amphimedon queenslandica TaxID=400682 RepID=A0A1X7VQS5_AMPQE|nr:PREDICTED: eukaryotic translation initiation factor 4E type 2-like [Amphimedon queenslandica]|eukprot:XP_003383247.1 PREDICTED: eukaryotic translation initiation factor 4E type 2-like [Amphimedon queenslandica]
MADIEVTPPPPEPLTAKSIDKIAVPDVPEGEHRLQYSYSLWFMQRGRGSVSSATSDYEDQIKHVGAFSSVEQFWSYYCHIAHPSDLPPHCDIHVFKMGIKPMWEDTANKDGGKWIVRLRKEISSRSWENLLLAMLGEQFIVGNEICGAVISVRPTEDIVSIWNRTASNDSIVGKIRDTLQRILQLPSQTIMEYKAHDQSLKDKSSFRNTALYVR